ncbi:EthD family reductase [Blastopirellula marina]|uniref:Ethyl tert-butyl ether degradation protein EthD n=2 Tax=Blastopirellula marina TaxID=124 RepID=A0A2S8G9R5_9BACT|nr:ethyl tert-butyl ether degradation protein EthD [Blastopirellula marina]PTL46074.1 EthD family reductase [Blastopirellula marina]
MFPRIHQLIFAKPKPGMSEAEFQHYWVHVHSPNFASKIPQIRRYLVDTRVPLAGERGEPLFSGIAEIWLENEEQQLASLQTPEFLEGARRDEPNWAAFWGTVVLDTNTDVLLPGPTLTAYPTWIKLVVLLKRREDLALPEFRQRMLKVQAPKAQQLTGLQRYLQCHVKDSFYDVGEPPFDGVAMYWFNTLADLEHAMTTEVWSELREVEATFVETKYRHHLALKEHWIIGPS